ncbi:MAG: hypothetical protein OXC68_09370 [Aestuariivita sp.]|nr:hypothetical protein [Aestuariivita sp.]
MKTLPGFDWPLLPEVEADFEAYSLMKTQPNSEPVRWHDNLALSEGQASLSLIHLQLGTQAVTALSAMGVSRVGELISFSESNAFGDFRYKLELLDALTTFAATTIGNRTDWLSYWKSRGYRFYYLAADLSELMCLDEESFHQPINRKTFGNAGAMLEKAGYKTLGSVAEGLRTGIQDVRGMGSTKIHQFFERLIEIVETLMLVGQVELDESSKLIEEDSVDQVSDLPRPITQLSVGVLHLGSKSRWVHEAGFFTVGDIADSWPIEHGDIVSLGSTWLELLVFRFLALVHSVTADERIDWEKYYELSGISPDSPSVAPITKTGRSATINQSLTEISDYLRNRDRAENPGPAQTEPVPEDTPEGVSLDRIRLKGFRSVH